MRKNGDKNNNLLRDEYLNKINPYFEDIIMDLIRGKFS